MTTIPSIGARALLAAASLAAACGGGAAGEAPRARNLILISIDTLRADRLGCYGAERATSPALDAFAADAVRFEHAYAAAPWTLPSHVTMLSGLLPRTHGVDLPDLRPGPDVRLLAEALRDAGFYTFAHTDGGWLGADFDLDRGFLAFDDTDRDLADMLDEARATIDQVHGERRFLAFLHTFDVHCPYAPGPPYDALFSSPGATPLSTAGRCGNPHYNAMDLEPGHVRFLGDVYDGGIRRADDALAGFLAHLRATGVLADTVVVVTSDHGEELGEHGRIGHEESLYPELLRVPLVVRAPGAAPRAVATPVGLVDLAPTLCALLGVPPLDDVDGRSLAPLFAGGSVAPRPVLAELAWKRPLSARVVGRRLAIDAPEGRECYDLERDPLAQVDLAPRGGCGAAAEAPAPPPATPRAPLPARPGAEAAERLRELGYAGR